MTFKSLVACTLDRGVVKRMLPVHQRKRVRSTLIRRTFWNHGRRRARDPSYKAEMYPPTLQINLTSVSRLDRFEAIYWKPCVT